MRSVGTSTQLPFPMYTTNHLLSFFALACLKGFRFYWPISAIYQKEPAPNSGAYKRATITAATAFVVVAFVSAEQYRTHDAVLSDFR